MPVATNKSFFFDAIIFIIITLLVILVWLVIKLIMSCIFYSIASECHKYPVIIFCALHTFS